jgi:hypothetical protein
MSLSGDSADGSRDACEHKPGLARVDGTRNAGEGERPSRPILRLIGVLSLAAALTGSFLLGIMCNDIGPFAREATLLARQLPNISAPPDPDDRRNVEPRPVYNSATAFPQVQRLARPVSRQPEARAQEARAKAIRDDKAAILAECQRAAGGDWARWATDTAPYRAALKAKVDALNTLNSSTITPDSNREALAGRGDFPLFEIRADHNLNYLYNPATLAPFRKSRLVEAADRWLRRRGIDLIFVPVPKMTEVYVEHFLEPCPRDGIIAPQVRQTLWELLDADVEVVDGLRLFRGLRDDGDEEYLYNTGDTHWAPRGMRAMAKEIADRISRYHFGSRARLALPIYRTSPGPYDINGSLGGMGSLDGWAALSREQQERARAHQTTNLAEVLTLDGTPLRDDTLSPVFVIGHSYVTKFEDQLAKELNMPVHASAVAGETTGFFADFLRSPELLNPCRVLVWITTEQHLTHFDPMPAPIMATLDEGK